MTTIKIVKFYLKQLGVSGEFHDIITDFICTFELARRFHNFMFTILLLHIIDCMVHFEFLLSDIASSLGPHVRDDMSKPYVQALLKEGFDTGEDSIKQTCMWANGVVQQIIR